MFKQSLGGLLIVAGIIAAGGASGDCDGKCMEFANSLGEMLIISLIGLTLMGTGSILILLGEEDNARKRN